MLDTREMTSADSSPAASSGNDTPGGVGERIDRIERQFAVLFNSYRQGLRQQSTEIDPALQSSGYRTLLEIALGGPTGASTLAESLGVDKSVLSRQLHQLEALGLVSRDQDPADRRAVIISATDEALARVNRIRSSARDQFRRALAEWGERDLDELARLLSKL